MLSGKMSLGWNAHQERAADARDDTPSAMGFDSLEVFNRLRATPPGSIEPLGLPKDSLARGTSFEGGGRHVARGREDLRNCMRSVHMSCARERAVNEMKSTVQRVHFSPSLSLSLSLYVCVFVSVLVCVEIIDGWASHLSRTSPREYTRHQFSMWNFGTALQ
jgi:hypothetical protein